MVLNIKECNCKIRLYYSLLFDSTKKNYFISNTGIKSIEEELFKALVKVEAISKSNSVDPKKVQLMRAARTDKGVHASFNLVSLKMIYIRIWGKKGGFFLCNGFFFIPLETQRAFHAKTRCDSRIYEYLLHSYTLKPLGPPKELKLELASEKDFKLLTENGAVARYISPTDQHTLSSFRIDQERFEKFKTAMSLYQGTRNFHNYTIARSFKEPASKRFMIDISVSSS